MFREKAKKYDDLMSLVLKVSGVVPVLGIVSAFCYEKSYFKVLGIDLGNIFEIRDLLNSSVFFVFPTFALMMLGYLFGGISEKERGSNSESNNSSSKHSVSSWFPYIVFFSIVVSTVVFALVGIRASATYMGVALTGIFILRFYGIRYFIQSKIDLEIVLAIFFLAGFLALVAGVGAESAYRDVRNKSDKLPDVFFQNGQTITEDLYLLRNLSTGTIAMNGNYEISFFASDTNMRIDFQKQKPWQGIICAWFSVESACKP